MGISAKEGLEIGKALAEGFREGIEENMGKTLKEKWMIGKKQAEERVYAEMETLPILTFDDPLIQCYNGGMVAIEIDNLDEDAKHILGIETSAPMDLEDYKELADFQKLEIQKLKQQKNELKIRLKENIDIIAKMDQDFNRDYKKIQKERDLWKLTAELLYDRLSDTLRLFNKRK